MSWLPAFTRLTGPVALLVCVCACLYFLMIGAAVVVALRNPDAQVREDARLVLAMLLGVLRQAHPDPRQAVRRGRRRQP
jgi:hypothetical protein